MSRCYVFPPPGYVKEAVADLGLSTKKHKHKDKKKKKRRRDSETNGDANDGKREGRKQGSSKVEGTNAKIKGAKVDDSSRIPDANNSLGDGNKALAKPKGESDVIRKRESDFLPRQEGGWSVVDDQEWLFLHNAHLPSNKLSVKAEDGSSSNNPPQVWADALHLPSINMYALPYVVPF